MATTVLDTIGEYPQADGLFYATVADEIVIPTNTWTSIQFSGHRDVKNLGHTIGTSQVNAAFPGIYLIDTSIKYTKIVGFNPAITRILVNGSHIGYSMTEATNEPLTTSVLRCMGITEYGSPTIEFQFYGEQETTVQAGIEDTFMRIIRLR